MFVFLGGEGGRRTAGVPDRQAVPHRGQDVPAGVVGVGEVLPALRDARHQRRRQAVLTGQVAVARRVRVPGEDHLPFRDRYTTRFLSSS